MIINTQAQALMDKGLITKQIAIVITAECGKDGDIGLFLGHLLYTGRIGAHVVQAFLGFPETV